MAITKELKEIILKKCDEREKQGHDFLTDSDVMDVLEECHRRKIPVSRKDLKQLGMD